MRDQWYLDALISSMPVAVVRRQCPLEGICELPRRFAKAKGICSVMAFAALCSLLDSLFGVYRSGLPHSSGLASMLDYLIVRTYWTYLGGFCIEVALSAR